MIGDMKMFENLEKKENLENLESNEEKVLEVNDLVEPTDNNLTESEKSVFDSVDDSLAKELMKDDEKLSELEKNANSTETIDGPDSTGDVTIEGGSPCKSGGCSGSTWCYGSGDFRR